MPTTLLERPVATDARLITFLLKNKELQQSERKTFRYSIDICLKDSNAYGNTYFARYFEWQGVCRERWFYECISSDMLQSLGVFVTKDAHQEYVHETFPFQQVECEVNTFDIKQCSFSLLFRFYVGGKLVAKGDQKIVFADKERKISRLPKDILEQISRYEYMQERRQFAKECELS